MCYTILDIFDLSAAAQTASSNGIIQEDDELGGTWFDQDEVIRRLRETFRPVIFGANDPLIEEAKRAEAYFASQGEADSPAVRSLFRKAETYGPALTFTVANKRGDTVTGMIRRYDIRFTYRKDISKEMRMSINEFLQSFAIGKVEELQCEA